ERLDPGDDREPGRRRGREALRQRGGGVDQPAAGVRTGERVDAGDVADGGEPGGVPVDRGAARARVTAVRCDDEESRLLVRGELGADRVRDLAHRCPRGDRKSTRLNSSHLVISYA